MRAGTIEGAVRECARRRAASPPLCASSITTRGSAGHFGPLIPFAAGPARRRRRRRSCATSASTADARPRPGLRRADLRRAAAPRRARRSSRAPASSTTTRPTGSWSPRCSPASTAAPRSATCARSSRLAARPRAERDRRVRRARSPPSSRRGPGRASSASGCGAVELKFMPVRDRRARAAARAARAARRAAGARPAYLTLAPAAARRAGRAARRAASASGPRRPQPLPDWWDGDARRSSTSRSAPSRRRWASSPALYRAAIDALAALPVRVLVTTGRDHDPARARPAARAASTPSAGSRRRT